jgi:ribokinase
LVIRCAAFARAGETIIADSSTEIGGGKGANQAVAAAKAGGLVTMIGRVGDDAFAERMIESLSNNQVDCEGVVRTRGCASGLAVVTVEASGQNSIMVVPGANGQVSCEDVQRHRTAIEQAAVILLQLEIPIESVLECIAIAKSAGVRVIVDPAPVPKLWTDALLAVDLVCPNEMEASAITGIPIETFEDASNCARILHQRGARHVAITMGERGTVLLTNDQLHVIPSFPVEAVDSTAAGDAFAGALAVRWAETDDLVEAVRFGNAAGAIAASRHGAQPSMGNRQMIELLRNTYK